MQGGVFWKSSQQSSVLSGSKNVSSKPLVPDATKLVWLL